MLNDDEKKTLRPVLAALAPVHFISSQLPPGEQPKDSESIARLAVRYADDMLDLVEHSKTCNLFFGRDHCDCGTDAPLVKP